MRQDGPSVEEILQSIKRVMARDNQELLREQGDAPRGARVPDDQQPEPADEDEAEDVLGMSGPPLSEAHDSTQDAEMADEAGTPPGGDTQTASYGQAAEGPDHGIDALTSPGAAVAMRRSLAALELVADRRAGGQGGGQAGGQGDTSLDATVRDMLRPMLADWLEAHLPAIVERHVRAEIARIAGGRS